MLPADQVPRGKLCGCVCPACQAPLVARQGNQIAWHFAHESLSDCRGAVETAIHRFAKQVILDSRTIRLPESFVTVGGHSERILWPYNYSYSGAEQEVTIGDVRLDALVSTEFSR